MEVWEIICPTNILKLELFLFQSVCVHGMISPVGICLLKSIGIELMTKTGYVINSVSLQFDDMMLPHKSRSEMMIYPDPIFKDGIA